MSKISTKNILKKIFKSKPEKKVKKKVTATKVVKAKKVAKDKPKKVKKVKKVVAKKTKKTSKKITPKPVKAKKVIKVAEAKGLKCDCLFTGTIPFALSFSNLISYVSTSIPPMFIFL